MIKFVLGVLLGFLFSKKIENPAFFMEKIGQNCNTSSHSQDDNKIREHIYTIIG